MKIETSTLWEFIPMPAGERGDICIKQGLFSIVITFDGEKGKCKFFIKGSPMSIKHLAALAPLPFLIKKASPRRYSITLKGYEISSVQIWLNRYVNNLDEF